MAKVPARLRAVTYSLSPMRTGVMHGLFKDWAAGMAKRVKENAVDVGLFCALPLGATVWCVPSDERETTRVDSMMREGDSRARTRGWTADGGGREGEEGDAPRVAVRAERGVGWFGNQSSRGEGRRARRRCVD